jgi:hypothetical protein
MSVGSFIKPHKFMTKCKNMPKYAKKNMILKSYKKAENKNTIK